MRQVVAVIVAVSLCLTVSCGTITTGGTQMLRANSDPSGATVTASPSGVEYVTPAGFELERKGTYVLTISKEGYRSTKAEIHHQMRGWMLVWDIFWFPIGVIVDAITGGWYRLSPEQVSVTLMKESAAIEWPEQIQVSLWVEKGTDGKEKLGIDASLPTHVSVERK